MGRGLSALLTMLLVADVSCRYGYDPLGDSDPLAPDADPLAPDADPLAPDADSLAPDADSLAPDAAVGGSADAATMGSAVVFGEGAGADHSSVTSDAPLNNQAPDFNYGAATSFNIRGDMISVFNGLLHFDVSALAPGTPVLAAELRLTTTSTSSVSQGEVALFRVTEGWDEGSEVAATGTASWNERMAGVAWATPGGTRSRSPVGSFAPTSSGTQYTVSLPASLVQSWVDSPGSNHGLLLVASGFKNGSTIGFHSSEDSFGQPALRVSVP